MMKHILFFCLLVTFIPATAQEADSVEGQQRFTDYLNTMLYEKFMFDSPGREFQLLEDSSGFQYLEKKATIKVLVTMGSFEELVADFRKSVKWENYTLLDSSFFTSPRIGFTKFYEASPPEGEVSENFIAMMTIFPFSKNVSVGVIGGYPKSMDAQYRKKFIAAALTLRHME